MSIYVLALVALIGVVPVLLLVAALQRLTLSEANKAAVDSLGNWAGMAPEAMHVKLRTTIGAAVVVGLLVVLAMGLHELGNASMPALSKMFKHFNEPYTAWSIKHEQEWMDFERDVGKVLLTVHDQDAATDVDFQNKWNNGRSAIVVSVAQTLVFFSVFLAIAGMVDLAYSLHIVRGVLVLVLGLFVFVFTVHVWTEQKSVHIREVYLANKTLGENSIDPPKSYPHETVD